MPKPQIIINKIATMNLSVVICSHNPRRESLGRTLQALMDQSLATNQWELIVVDNLSSPPLGETLNLDWHPLHRIVREEELGILPARVRGLKEADAELILFVDDDNVLASNYLEQAVLIGDSYPFLGAWGGSITPEFEVPPPPWIEEFRYLLACVEVQEDRWSNLRHNHVTTPPTAGMCLRRIVADAFVEVVRTDPRRQVLGRRGKNQLSNAEDTDLAWTACDIGLGTGQFARLRLTHLIPAGRLTEDYLLRLAEGTAFCDNVLNALRGRPPVLPHTSCVRSLLGKLRRCFWKTRRRQRFEGQLRALKQACATVAQWSMIAF